MVNAPANVTNILMNTSFGLQGLAIILTVFRLWYRARIQRFWWEDAWAMFALLLGLLYLVSNVVYLHTSNIKVSAVSFWVFSFSFTSVLWTIRMSLIFSISRLMPATRNRRILTLSVSGLFAVLWASLIIQKAYLCGHHSYWYPDCHLKRPMVIFEFCSDAVADIILVVVPLRLVRNVKLPPNQRRMIMSIFCSSLMSSLGSFFHGGAQLVQVYSLVNPAGNFEVAISLIVCNLLVIITWIYRLIHSDEESDWPPNSDDNVDGDNGSTVSMPLQFTTVDLNQVTGEISFTDTSGQSS